MSVDPTTLVAMYRQMLRIRMVEERIESEYHLDEMRTPVHLCIGQEAVAVGVCSALNRDDYVQSNHRGHGHYLAKGGDLEAMIAELYCRRTGCSQARGGSMHLVAIDVGHLGSSSIVGGGIPIAVGLGLASAMQGEDRVSVAFFGDGAADEGVLYESVNFTMLKRLPVVFVLENNQWSVCSRVGERQDGANVFLHLPEERLATASVDGNDVLAVYEEARAAVERARRGRGPSFIECITYRIRGHAGAYSDARLGYRTQEEIDAWSERCPVARLRARLQAEGLVTEAALGEMQATLEREIEAAFRRAQAGPLPTSEDLEQHLFVE